MRLRLPIAVGLAAALCIGAAARTAADFFTSAPDSIYRMLPQSTRLDMLDYFRYNSPHASPNNLGGEARITAESERALSYELTGHSRGQLAVVTTPADTLLAVVTTVPTPLPDSRIDWYRTDWTPAPAPVALPAYADWLADGASEARAREIAPFLLVDAWFSPQADVLILHQNASGFVSDALSAEVDSLFRQSITYTDFRP